MALGSREREGEIEGGVREERRGEIFRGKIQAVREREREREILLLCLTYAYVCS